MSEHQQVKLVVRIPVQNIQLTDEEKGAIRRELDGVKIREILQGNPTLRDIKTDFEADIEWHQV